MAEKMAKKVKMRASAWLRVAEMMREDRKTFENLRSFTIDKNVGYQWSTQYMASHTESSKAVFEEKNGLRIAFGIASHPNSKVNDVTEKYDT